ncbi:MAG TPA: HAD-IA family hydrolase [Phycisphaerae bacterium]|nr:HAD-IA family hydrolase [Phycisphaerae bacterium]
MPGNDRSRRFRPRAILLDFYGTVVAEDDAPIGRICERIASASPLPVTAGEVGSCWGEAFIRLCSQSFGNRFQSQKELERVSLRRVLGRFRAELDAAALSRPLLEYWSSPQMFPESKSVLAECGVPICLVSNIDNAELASALRHSKLDFEHAVTSEDCRAYKPRREVFAKALSLLGMGADEVLHVGDSLGSDVRGARAAGIRVLWVNRKGRPAPAGGAAPTYTSPELTGLLQVL